MITIAVLAGFIVGCLLTEWSHQRAHDKRRERMWLEWEEDQLRIGELLQQEQEKEVGRERQRIERLIAERRFSLGQM